MMNFVVVLFQELGLLHGPIPCDGCNEENKTNGGEGDEEQNVMMTLGKDASRLDGITWRCRGSKHRKSIRTGSFFSGSHYPIQVCT